MYDREKYILSDSSIKTDLLKLFDQNERLTIFDIGGCEGEESIRYSRLFPNAAVFIFEPLPKNQQLIQQNIKKYNCPGIKLFPIALSDSKTVEKFYVSSGQPEEMKPGMDWDFGNKSSSLLPPDKHIELVPWLKFEDVIEVHTDTLKNVLSENNIMEIDFIHMDVQGAELKVLRGAGSALQTVKAIWLEVADITLYKDQPKKNDIERFMKSNNFHLVKTSLDNGIGDQMYLNKRYFRTISLFSFKKYIRLKVAK